MNGQHTPGPWEVDEKHNGVYQAAITEMFTCEDGQTGRKGLIALTYERWEVGDYSDGANARLIAAAPDLLAALKEIAESWALGSYERSIAERAIRKAEGAHG